MPPARVYFSYFLSQAKGIPFDDLSLGSGMPLGSFGQRKVEFSNSCIETQNVGDFEPESAD